MFNFNRSKGTIDKPCQFSISIRSMYLAFSLDAVKLKENLVSRQQVVTDSGKLDWNCWSYPPRLVFPLFLARRPPFVLYSTSHPSVTSQEAGMVPLYQTKGHHFAPHETPALTHWPGINASNQRLSTSNNAKRFLFIQTSFSKQLHTRGVSIPTG